MYSKQCPVASRAISTAGTHGQSTKPQPKLAAFVDAEENNLVKNAAGNLCKPSLTILQRIAPLCTKGTVSKMQRYMLLTLGKEFDAMSVVPR
jgi:hypothetical protein